MTKIFFLQFLFVVAISVSCKERFEPAVIQTDLSALVVDGFINNTSDTTFIYLSRTKKLGSGILNSQENNAQLSIEDANGNTLYHFQQLNDSGTYIVPGINLDKNNKYRLRIITSNSKQYLSDEIPVVKTPPIDSIAFAKTDKGVVIHANTHDPLNNTRYYRWQYTETWNYHSRYVSTLTYKDGSVIDRPLQDYIYDCWKTQKSTELLLGSSAKLSDDIIYHNPIRGIDQNSFELSIKYFIFLKQYALTKASYEYIVDLKKITEQTGSIFDAQPSQLTDNIHALNNPDEPVLGYITVSTEESKKLYITNAEVQPWFYLMPCTERKIKLEDFSLYFGKQGLIPTRKEGSGMALQVYGSERICVDCRALGGTTTKLGFWQ